MIFATMQNYLHSNAMTRALLVLFLIVMTHVHANADASCRKNISPAIKEINQQVRVLYGMEPKVGSGPQVAVGSCASRLRKLAGNFLCCTTFANTAKVWEEISCLELKKHYLEKSCECDGVGGYSESEILQDQVLEQYALFKAIRKKALERALPNKLIRQYVEAVSKKIDCLNSQTLEIVSKSTSALEKEIEKAPE